MGVHTSTAHHQPRVQSGGVNKGESSLREDESALLSNTSHVTPVRAVPARQHGFALRMSYLHVSETGSASDP